MNRDHCVIIRTRYGLVESIHVPKPWGDHVILVVDSTEGAISVEPHDPIAMIASDWELVALYSQEKVMP